MSPKIRRLTPAASQEEPLPPYAPLIPWKHTEMLNYHNVRGPKRLHGTAWLFHQSLDSGQVEARPSTIGRVFWVSPPHLYRRSWLHPVCWWGLILSNEPSKIIIIVVVVVVIIIIMIIVMHTTTVRPIQTMIMMILLRLIANIITITIIITHTVTNLQTKFALLAMIMILLLRLIAHKDSCF